MSTLRKMGAFLGLVPDDARYGGDRARDNGEADGYGEHSGYAAPDYTAEYDDAGDYRGAGYADSQHPDDRHSDYQRGDSRDYGDYRDADDAGAGYPGRYGSDGDTADDYRYGAADSYSADSYTADSYSADSYSRADSYSYADSSGGFNSADPADTAADRREPVSQRTVDTQPAGTATLSAAKSGRRERNEHNDFRTQGALAVQPEPYSQPVAESAGKPVTVTLTGFADARQVGESYREGTAVILDMTDLTDAEARRMVDFAAGLAFAVHGSIDKVTTKVFMLHPPTAS